MSQPGTTVLLPLLQPSSGQSPMEAEPPLKSHLSLLAETQKSAPGTGHPDRPVAFCCLPPGFGHALQPQRLLATTWVLRAVRESSVL